MKKVDHPIRIRISSGGYTANVMAQTPEEAFELFLDMKKPKGLGILTQIKAKELADESGDSAFYMLTTVLLERVGRLEHANT